MPNPTFTYRAVTADGKCPTFGQPIAEWHILDPMGALVAVIPATAKDIRDHWRVSVMTEALTLATFPSEAANV